MKPFKDVDKERYKYHNKEYINTVHRSSLLVPKLKNNKTFVSFLNHFLIKRNYSDVVLKISPYKLGNCFDSKTFLIDQAKVYTFNLDETFDENCDCYQLEFFSGNNLYIPFPAVIINHIGSNSINTVHSYNRVLNDAKEEESINKIKVNEASIDFIDNETFRTFIVFQSGILSLENKILKLIFKKSNSKELEIIKKINLTMPKMHSKKIDISALIKDQINREDIKAGEYSIQIEQPNQEFFYGRLLVGIEDISSNSYSGNHSYYDNSKNKEYFGSSKSYRIFPYFKNSKNIIRIYPVMSPGRGNFKIFANYKENNNILTKELGTYFFINNESTLCLDIGELIISNKLENRTITFTVIYESLDGYKTPTRVNMQLVYGKEKNKVLDASINVSLLNDEIFLPPEKKSHSWIQMVNKKNYSSQLGICFSDDPNNHNKKESLVKISIYDENGNFLKKEISLKSLECFFINSNELNTNSDFVWVTCETDRPNLFQYTYQTNIEKYFSSGEHSF